MIKDINWIYENDEILSLIYPTSLNKQSLIMVVNLSNDGIYEKIELQKELLRGEKYYVGMPSGLNKQFIDIQQNEIIVMINLNECSSRKHAHIKVQNGRVYLFDGYDKQVSKNGVWVLIKHQKLSNQNQYCFKDFRLAVKLKY